MNKDDVHELLNTRKDKCLSTNDIEIILNNEISLYDKPVEIYNYHQVVPDSHFYTTLGQIIRALDRKEDLDYIKIGIENTIKQGYYMNEK